MSAIKKQFRDFWLYFKLTKFGVNMADVEAFKRNKAIIFSCIAACLLVIFQFSDGDGESLLSISGLILYIPFLCGTAIGMGMLSLQKPSLMSVAPFTPKQRIVFSYLTAVLRALILFVFAMIIALAVLIVIGLLFSLAAGNLSVVFENNDGYTHMNAYEFAFDLLLSLIYFFAFFALSHIDDRNYRNIAAVSVVAILFALSLVFTNICGHAMHDADEQTFFFSVNVADGMAALAYPWVVIIIQAVLAIAAFTASLFATVNRYRSTDV